MISHIYDEMDTEYQTDWSVVLTWHVARLQSARMDLICSMGR